MSNELLLPLGWVIGGGFWQTLAICLLICPIGPQILGAVCDGFWVPWDPRYQFLAFMPGNPFLALFIAGSSLTFHESGVSISPTLNYSILVGAFVIYVALNLLDLKSNYTIGQMLSWAKVYHNALYFWYGYLAVVCTVGLWNADASVFRWVGIMTFGLLWLACLVADNFMPSDIQAQRFKYAHAESVPIWRNGWRVRRRTPDGYR
jgi:hypothetical protein